MRGHNKPCTRSQLCYTIFVVSLRSFTTKISLLRRPSDWSVISALAERPLLAEAV